MNPTPLEQLLEVATGKHNLSVGVPASLSAVDRRFPLTPEGAAMLVARGLDVRVERGAGAAIHYDDERYTRAGAAIVTRAEALQCDIVLHLPPMATADARCLRRGALLLTLLHPDHQNPEALKVLLDRRIMALALDLVTDREGHKPFADVLDEIDGRAALAVASSLLADSKHGKGILLGGIPGLQPCEVTIIGAGIAGLAAARSALGMGAMVRLFDTDIYRLRRAVRYLGDSQVIASAMHPRALIKALGTADVVVSTPVNVPHIVGPEAVSEMKKGVVTFSLNDSGKPMFPTMTCVDLASERTSKNQALEGRGICYINAGGAVPRTVAMALSDTLVTMFGDIVNCAGSLSNSLKLHTGMQRAAFTFLGRPTEARIAALLDMRPVDIALLLQFS